MQYLMYLLKGVFLEEFMHVWIMLEDCFLEDGFKSDRVNLGDWFF